MDDDGFREFVEIRYADLLRTAYLLTGTRDAAQDLLHGALLKAMRRWRRLDEPMAYVRKILVNERTSLWRRIGSRELLTPSVPDRVRPDEADAVVVRDELLTALQRLPARTRESALLLRWGGSVPGGEDRSPAVLVTPERGAGPVVLQVGSSVKAMVGLSAKPDEAPNDPAMAESRRQWALLSTGFATSPDLVAVRVPGRSGAQAVLTDRLLVVGPKTAASVRVLDGTGKVLATAAPDDRGAVLVTVPVGTKGTVQAVDAAGATIASTKLAEQPGATPQLFGEQFVSTW